MFDVVVVPFNNVKDFEYEYKLTPQEISQVASAAMNSHVRPAIAQIAAALGMGAVAGDLVRAANSTLRGALGVIGSASPKLKLIYKCKGSCADLPAVELSLIDKELDGPTGSVSANVPLPFGAGSIGIGVKYSHSFESVELETYYGECVEDGEDGMFKGTRFLHKLRLRFELTVATATVSLPAIRKDNFQTCITNCCSEYEPDDFDRSELALGRERGARAELAALSGRRRKGNREA